MDVLMKQLQTSMLLEDDEVKEIKLQLFEQVIRRPQHLVDETEESLELIGLKKRVARKLIELVLPTAETLPISTQIEKIGTEEYKEQNFKEKLRMIEDAEEYVKIRFEYVNSETVYDPIVENMIKLGAPYKISNVNTRIKYYKGLQGSDRMKNRFEAARSMVEKYLTEIGCESEEFTIDRDLIERGKAFASRERKRKAPSQIELCKRQKGF